MVVRLNESSVVGLEPDGADGVRIEGGHQRLSFEELLRVLGP